jgi:hypothetical protein
MLSLREYREPTHRLPDYLPWAALVGPGVVLQKDAIVQKTIAFRGPDLASAMDTEFVAATARISDARFAGTWRVDGRGNVLFAHTDDGGAVTGFEVKNRGFTGFASGGSKSAWRSAVREGDRALVVAESAIDALSFHQLYPRADARYWSTAGWPSARQGEQLVRALGDLPRGGRLVLATDADAAGERLAQKLGELARGRSEVRVERAAPCGGKDWNDVLQRIERDAIRALPAAVRALGPARGRER